MKWPWTKAAAAPVQEKPEGKVSAEEVFGTLAMILAVFAPQIIGAATVALTETEAGKGGPKPPGK